MKVQKLSFNGSLELSFPKSRKMSAMGICLNGFDGVYIGNNMRKHEPILVIKKDENSPYVISFDKDDWVENNRGDFVSEITNRKKQILVGSHISVSAKAMTHISLDGARIPVMANIVSEDEFKVRLLEIGFDYDNQVLTAQPIAYLEEDFLIKSPSFIGLIKKIKKNPFLEEAGASDMVSTLLGRS